jgi:hypothetical protein
MPDKQIQISVKLPGETIVFPPVLLKGQTAPILPFNLRIGRTVVAYATAQPFARFDNGGRGFVFFRKLAGVKPELCLKANGVAGIEAKNWLVEKANGEIRIKSNTGNVVNVIQADGHRVSLIFLTEEEAEDAWETDVRGKRILFVSAADLIIQRDDQVIFQQTANPVFDMKTFPAGMKIFPVRPGSDSSTRDFDRYRFSVAAFRPQWSFQKKGSAGMILHVPETLPSDLADLILTVDYVGGGCTVSQNKNWKTDNLFNGQRWTLGLKGFLGSDPLMFQIKHWDRRITGLPASTVAEIKRVGASFKEVQMQPRYQCVLPLVR